MKKNFAIILIMFLMMMSNNGVFAAKNVQLRSMLEIREIQTHFYDTTDTKQVVKAVINTLQDNGFIIQNIEPDLGYIRAKKEVKLKRTLKGRIVTYSILEAVDAVCLGLSFGLNPFAAWDMYVEGIRIKNEIAPHTVIYDSNIDIQKHGKKTKVRFSVIEKVLENGDGYTTFKSSPRKVVRHYEPELYQEFFSQVDKNLFLEKSL